MQKINNQIGERVRLYRQQRGLTQEALALSSGINVSFLGDVERGNKKPSIETLEKLLGSLRVTFQEFFDFETQIKPLKDCTALEKLVLGLQGRSENEVEMIYGVVQSILVFNDGSSKGGVEV